MFVNMLRMLFDDNLERLNLLVEFFHMGLFCYVNLDHG